MSDILIVDNEDVEFIWDVIQQLQVIFHPDIAPDGKINYEKFFSFKSKKPIILFVDRNILSGLFSFCENGKLKSKKESQIIALIMIWAALNDTTISAGPAIKERAVQLGSQENALIELRKFQEIFNAYPLQMWLRVAEGCQTEIPPITYTNKPAESITVDFADSGDHYEMAVATLIRVVQLYRDRIMKPVEKTQELFGWMCDKLMISEYILSYAAMLFTSQDGIKAPKHANSNEIEKVIAGCENQAWDFSYLTTWSTLYSNTNKYDEEFLFATNDVLLKRIFINLHAPYGFNGLLFEIFSKKDYNQLIDYIEKRMKNRLKPDFGNNPHEYFQKVIESEKRQLTFMLDSGKT